VTRWTLADEIRSVAVALVMLGLRRVPIPILRWVRFHVRRADIAITAELTRRGLERAVQAVRDVWVPVAPPPDETPPLDAAVCPCGRPAGEGWKPGESTYCEHLGQMVTLRGSREAAVDTAQRIADDKLY